MCIRDSTISGNSAKWDVGALQGANGLEFINNRGGVLIENNSVDGVAGAMLCLSIHSIYSLLIAAMSASDREIACAASFPA